MTDTVKVESRTTMTRLASDDRGAAERLEVLESQNEEMRDKLLDANAENNKYQQKLERLTHENKKLKQSPLFVATVQEITDEGVIIKQHGNNQEALTEVTDEMREELEPDDRVAVNNSLSIVKQLDDETDVRARVMQVDQSPDVTFADIGGIEEQMDEVRETVEMPLKSPEMFEQVGIQPPSGVLLYGPPGTGKTMLAKAVANQTNASFIKMAGSELVHKFIGEGAKLVRDLFEVAREDEPAVVFIDEIDAIAAKRTESKTSGDAEVQRTMMRYSRRWTASMNAVTSASSPRRTASTCSTVLSSAPAGSTASSRSRTPTSRVASRSSRSTPAA